MARIQPPPIAIPPLTGSIAALDVPVSAAGGFVVAPGPSAYTGTWGNLDEGIGGLQPNLHAPGGIILGAAVYRVG